MRILPHYNTWEYTHGKSRKFNRTNLKLLVQWAGYDDSYNTWEPYKELRYTEQFHQFCREKGYKYLIPPNLEPIVED